MTHAASDAAGTKSPRSSLGNAQAPGPERTSARRRTFQQFMKKPAGLVGSVIVALVILMALLAPLIAPHDPLQSFRGLELQPPSGKFLLGTDELGRDLFSRVLYGGRVSLIVSFIAVVTAGALGAATGMAAGFFERWYGGFMMRAWDTVFAIPPILIGLALATAFGPSPTIVAVAVGVASAPIFARVGRAAVVQESKKEYVEAGRALGMSRFSVFRTHVLHNAMSPLLVQVPLAAGLAVIIEASLSFLGLGAQPPRATWGGELAASQQYMREAWWYGVFPGIAITVFVLGLNLMADALRDVLDPHKSQ